MATIASVTYSLPAALPNAVADPHSPAGAYSGFGRYPYRRPGYGRRRGHGRYGHGFGHHGYGHHGAPLGDCFTYSQLSLVCLHLTCNS